MKRMYSYAQRGTFPKICENIRIVVKVITCRSAWLPPRTIHTYIHGYTRKHWVYAHRNTNLAILLYTHTFPCVPVLYWCSCWFVVSYRLLEVLSQPRSSRMSSLHVSVCMLCSLLPTSVHFRECVFLCPCCIMVVCKFHVNSKMVAFLSLWI